MTDLSDNMRAMAQRNDVTDEQRATLIDLADKFDAAVDAVAAGQDGAYKRMLGCWARARKYWCELTGEPLV